MTKSDKKFSEFHTTLEQFSTHIDIRSEEKWQKEQRETRKNKRERKMIKNLRKNDKISENEKLSWRKFPHIWKSKWPENEKVFRKNDPILHKT